MAPWTAEVNRFCRQYLQLESALDYPRDEFLRLSDVQESIYTSLFADSAVEFAPPQRHQLHVLKQLTSRIEASIDDWDEHGVSDDLMGAMAALLATPQLPEVSAAQQKSYVTYHLSALTNTQDSSESSIVDEPHITLLENRYLIAASGTTGLRTWEAALHLGQYLCQSPQAVRERRILELGAGTGYLSILCANHLRATHVVSSDGSDDVINNLPENFFLNHLQDSDRISPMEVKWGHALLGTEEQQWNGGRPVDVVLGADITYDGSVIPALVGTLLDLFELYPAVEVYISATQRNEETFRVFLDKCRQNVLAVEDVQFEVPTREAQTGPFYNDQVAIRICKVSRA